MTEQAVFPPPSQDPASTGPRRLPGIDVLRGLAAVAVVVSHLSFSEVPPEGVHDLRWLLRIAQSLLGAWGVGLFFVISGLCVHLPRARSASPDPLRLGPYLRRRFLRIYPPHLVALLMCVAVARVLPVGVSTLLSTPTRVQLLLHVVLLHSFWPSAINSVSPVFWTIAVEAHFYLLYPLVLPAFRRLGIPRVTLVLLGLSIGARLLVLRFAPDFSEVVESNFVCRFWEWCLGCWIAEQVVARPSTAEPTGVPALGTVLLGALLLAVGLQLAARSALGVESGRLWANETRALLWPWVFALAALLAATLRGRSSRAPAGVLERLVRLGTMSYSLYLVHPIALALCGWAFVRWFDPGPSASECIAALLASLLLAKLFFRTVERFFWNRARSAPSA